jgi:integrase
MAKRNGNGLLTGSIVRKLKRPAKGNYIEYDGGPDSVAGFGARITAGGHRAFVLNYYAGGRERRYTIGSWPDWTCTAARKEARRLRHLVDQGGDPLADAQAEREAPTVNDLIARFKTEWLPKKRPGTQREYQGMIRLHIAPTFGRIKVAAVSHDDIDKLHRRITADGAPYGANRVASLCSRLFSLAVRWNMRATNPAKGIELNKEYGRRRYLRGPELEALLKALAAYPNRDIANVFRVLLATGARRGEVLAMRWADLDLDRGLWSKPPSATKQQQPHETPLAKPVQLLLAEIRQKQTAGRRQLPEFVFPSNSKVGCLTDVKKAWRRICKQAGLADLRIHDLRHSYASVLVSHGASLPLIASMLGHASAATASRYSHLFVDPMKAAAEKVAAFIDAADVAANGTSTPAPEPKSALISFCKPRRGRRG